LLSTALSPSHHWVPSLLLSTFLLMAMCSSVSLLSSWSQPDLCTLSPLPLILPPFPSPPLLMASRPGG
jgi:hypothetical protein